MDDLVAFLAARLDEDERRAKEWAEPGGSHWPWLEARVLREVAAKRAILAEHAPVSDITSFPLCRRCGRDDDMEPFPYMWPCATLRHLAAVYSDHPGYRHEWKP